MPDTTIRLEGRRPFFNSRTRGENYKKAFGQDLRFCPTRLGTSKTVVPGAVGLYYESTPGRFYMTETSMAEDLLGVFRSISTRTSERSSFSARRKPAIRHKRQCHPAETEQLPIGKS